MAQKSQYHSQSSSILNPVVENFLKACALQDGGQPTLEIRQTWQPFVDLARRDQTALLEAAAMLPQLEPIAASWASVALGAVVEATGEAERTAPVLMGLLREWLAKMPVETGEEEEPPLDAEQTTIAASLTRLCQATVAHLARVPALRAELAGDAALCERLLDLEEHSPGTRWVHEALIRESGSLLLLVPREKRGFRVVYRHVGNCFHLFSLLQGAIGPGLAGGREPDEDMVALAQGEYSDWGEDHAWWHYGSPWSSLPDMLGSIWGEGEIGRAHV